MIAQEYVEYFKQNNIFSVPDAIYVLFPFKLLHVHSNRKNKTKIHDIFGKQFFVLTVADGKINTTMIENPNANWDYADNRFYFKTEEDMITAKLLLL